MTDHDATCLATLVRSWDQALVHRPPRRGRASVPWPPSRVLWPPSCSSSCSRQNKFGDEYDETTAVSKQSNGFFSDYDRRKQLMLRESESSLLVQRLENPSRSSPGGSAFRVLPSRSWWWRLIAQPGVDDSFMSWSSKSQFCSDFLDSPMK